jgi:prepilin-type N-terminal cleavage/methylation domain-containing protein
MFNHLHRFKGFSLIELMTVLAIITALAVTATISYRDYTIRSTIGSLLPLAEQAKTDVENAHNQGTIFGSSGTQTYVSSSAADRPLGLMDIIRTGYGCVQIDINLTSIGLDGTKQLAMVLCPTINAASIEWQCGYSASSYASYLSYLPATCQSNTATSIQNTSF